MRTFFMTHTLEPEKRFKYTTTFTDERGEVMYVAHSSISHDDAKEYGKSQLRQMADFARIFDVVQGKATPRPQFKFMELEAEVA